MFDWKQESVHKFTANPEPDVRCLVELDVDVNDWVCEFSSPGENKANFADSFKSATEWCEMEYSQYQGRHASDENSVKQADAAPADASGAGGKAPPAVQGVGITDGAAPETQPASTDPAIDSIKQLFEQVYDQSGPEGLIDLCYASEQPETCQGVIDLIKADPQGVIDQMVTVLATEPTVVESWQSFLNSEPSPADPAAEAKADETVAGVEGKDIVDQVAKENPGAAAWLGTKSSAMNRMLSALHRTIRVASDEKTKSYWQAYFRQYGSMLIRDLALPGQTKVAGKRIASGETPASDSTFGGNRIAASSWTCDQNEEQGREACHKEVGECFLRVAQKASGNWMWEVQVRKAGAEQTLDGEEPSKEAAQDKAEVKAAEKGCGSDGGAEEPLPKAAEKDAQSEPSIKQQVVTTMDDKEPAAVTAKVAVDETTKSYWKAYFTAYGAELVRDLALPGQKTAAVRVLGDDISNVWTITARDVLRMENDYPNGAHGTIVYQGGMFHYTAALADGGLIEGAAKSAEEAQVATDIAASVSIVGEASAEGLAKMQAALDAQMNRGFMAKRTERSQSFAAKLLRKGSTK